MTSYNPLMTTKSIPHSGLRAGVAKVDITPPAGLPLWGYAARKEVSRGTMDPLYAHVLVLGTSEKSIAIVTVDLGRSFGPASHDRLRTAVKKSSNISHVLVSATHSHSGPVIRDENASEWETATVDKIAIAIDEAEQNSQEARIGIGYGKIYVGHNRRLVNQDRTITWLDRNLTKIPTAPVDPVITVLRIDSEYGSPLAILVNYACHPVIFGPDNLKYSAEFPGVLTKVVQQSFGSKPLCLFLQGAAGDINPYHAVTPLSEDAAAMRDWTGEELAMEAVRVAKAICTEASEASTIDCIEDQIDFNLRWQPDAFRQALQDFGKEHFESSAPSIQAQWSLPTVTVLINKWIAFMTMPGEPFIEFQLNWRDHCSVPDCLFLGYTNGYFGYFPTIAAAAEGGYGANSATTWLEVGAGERMLNQSLVRVNEMLGRLNTTPSTTEW